MKFIRVHQWTSDLKEAARLQQNMIPFVDIRPSRREFAKIAAVDVAYSKRDTAVFACAVVMNYPELTTLEKVRAQSYVSFPYIPGFLYFREGPVIAKALERLQIVPELIMFDGNGIAHPKRIGMASHFGVMLDLPTIGCAKKKLIGSHGDLADQIGSYVPLDIDGDQVGFVVRTRSGVKPLYVSPGHKIDAQTSLEIVLSATRGYRLPEPLRVAHIMVNKMRRNYDERLSQRSAPSNRDPNGER